MRPITIRDLVPSRCLLLELDDRLVLVDSGIGLDDIADPARRLGRPWVSGCRPLLDESSTAIRQVEAHGFHADDVTDIVLSHMDMDHAGGIGDFPHARVHVHAREAKAAHASVDAFPSPQRARYKPHHWSAARLVAHPPGNVTWQGIEGCITLPGTDERVLLVPLFGHSRGHCGVAVHVDDGWILHAADAVFDGVEGQRAPLALRLFDLFIAADGRAAARARDLVRDIVRHGGPDGPVELVTSHVP